MSVRERPWWRDFFDAGYRRLWAPVSGAERTEHELAGLVPALARWQEERFGGRPLVVADVCGGNGRLARPLAERTGHGVLVLDASHDMLAHGREAPGGERVVWLAADARALPLMAASCDVALCFFTSLGLCDDDNDHVRMLGEMARLLRPGGRLVLELTHRDYAVVLAERRTWFTLADGSSVLRSFDFDPLAGRTDESLRVVGRPRDALHSDGVGDEVRRWSVRLYTPTELGRMLRAVGLEPEGFYGDTSGAPFAVHEPRLVIVACRRDTGAQAGETATTMGVHPTSWRSILGQLRCPQTGQALELVEPARLEALNATLAEPLDAALVREDGRWVYPVRGEVPILLADEAIEIPASPEREAKR